MATLFFADTVVLWRDKKIHIDIFEREIAGEIISVDDPEYGKIAALTTEA